eukprot:GHRQ01006468.1.p1 GENE.GHRQ01006468.1~~GHRQ01006468.1.p1  ORF type:complete len:145 (+),score=11.81 GHRQ01006468.1:258-692(+)
MYALTSSACAPQQHLMLMMYMHKQTHTPVFSSDLRSPLSCRALALSSCLLTQLVHPHLYKHAHLAAEGAESIALPTKTSKRAVDKCKAVRTHPRSGSRRFKQQQQIAWAGLRSYKRASLARDPESGASSSTAVDSSARADVHTP